MHRQVSTPHCTAFARYYVSLTYRTWQVFTVGRIFAYLAVGYICNCVPVYSAEVSPAPLRGFCAGLLTPIISVSSIWGAGMCQAYAEELGKKGYIIPVASQAIPVRFQILQ